ncbi:MAG: T9SS type A sorting domain-containing protein [Bacteroidetes bacterium]|nr:T9SS type A sorting domain-containing protein [Bacteroidota bacterium]
MKTILYQSPFFIFLCFAIFSNQTIKSQSPTSWNYSGIGGGGALFSPSINPLNSSELYVSCDMGGLYHTTNSADTWQLIPHTQMRGGWRSKINFTNNASIRYSLSYKANGIQDQITPCKSMDGGITWNKLVGNPDDNEELFALYANYDNPNQVIISQWRDIYFSNDGGTTFSLVYTGLSSGAGCKLSGVCWDGSNIYLGTNDGIIRSTNSGASFSLFTTGGIISSQVISSFAAAREGGVLRFYALTSNAADVYNGDEFDFYQYMQGVYKMDNASGVWNTVWNGLDATTQYGKRITMASNDIDIVYISGETSGGYPMVLKTTNSGTIWNPIFTTTNNQNIYTGWCGTGGDVGWTWAELLFGMEVSALDANKLAISDYGFVHTSTDGGLNWHQAYTRTSYENPSAVSTPTKKAYQSAGDLNQVSVWQVYWMDSLRMWSCASDIKGTRSNDKGNTWSFNYTGHTENTSYRIIRNINNDNILYVATASVHDIYQSARLADGQLDASGNTGSIKFSSDKGQTWQVMHDFSDIVCWVATDPNDANILYASVVNSSNGNGGIWKCANASAGASSAWTKLSNPPRTEGHPYNIVVLNDGKVLVSYSGHRDPGFTASSGVFLYDPISMSWQDKSDAGMFYWTQDVIVDPHDATQNIWYACVYEGWGSAATQGVGGIYKTMNRGTSWTRIWNNERCHSVTISPVWANEIYVSTEYHGLLYCNNLTSASPTFSPTNYPFRNALRTFFNPYTNELWACGFGGGMMKGSFINSGIREIENHFQVSLYPNPVHDEITITGTNQLASIRLLNLQGDCIFYHKVSEPIGLTVTINLPQSISKGIYMLEVESKLGDKETRKIIVE